jgi:N-terminal domain on NACHT_NTPase and P-loop NTPases
MVLDPFTAIGLAGNIMQFVDVSYKLFSQTQETYHSVSGATKEIGNIAFVAQHLRELCTSLSTASQNSQLRSTSSPSDDKLRDLAKECAIAAAELVEVLDRLKAKDPNSKLSSFRSVLITLWKKNKIVDMETRLNTYRSQLNLQLEALQSYNNLVVSKRW